MAKRGGVVIRDGRALRFLPASVVVRIVPCPPVSRVPGAPRPLVGIAHTSGEIVPVVSIEPAAEGDASASAAPSPARAPTPGDRVLIVCRYLGEPVGLIGCEVLASGVYDPHPESEGAVMVDGVAARTLDLGAMFASLQTARWALRFGG